MFFLQNVTRLKRELNANQAYNWIDEGALVHLSKSFYNENCPLNEMNVP